MKIKSIYIKKLHDSYNYEINFNEDVTILYGLNGSGKTTILNIISYIISGQLYKLFNYDFDLIELCCKKVNSLDVFLFLFKRNGKRITYQINGGKSRTIILEEGMRDVEITRTEEYELETSSEFEEISKLFNAYYLPISRVGHFSNRNERNHLIYYQRRMTYHSNKIRNQDIIYDIEGLIRDYYLNNVRKIEIANKEFRNSLLKTFTNVSNTSFEDVFIKFIKSKNNSNKIKEIQSKYIKVLKDNEIIQDHEVSAYNDFFKEFIKSITGKRENEQSLNIILQYYEILKIEKILSIAEKFEAKKASINKPMDNFLKIINGFLGNNYITNKQLQFERGNLLFTDKGSNKLELVHLSSGEKQLIVFFARLIFMVDNSKTGIFIVDEPELSLHLTWQRDFIKKALSVSKNTQLIFATHSPEIISNHTNKMRELIRVISND